MKKFVALLLVLITSAATLFAQNGVAFTKGLSWAQIKEKAKTEQRYIFVDTYTTWCLPCKEMEKEIFPQPAVGAFFNANFINVALQLDVTKKDNEEVKRRYEDARYFLNTYKIRSFPTYLFFDPYGELVHTINGASSTGEEFIA
ncbi:MAG TPA: thioredoxin fold domain-containing protein, partial [Sphingobacteriaceae bacterium]